MVVLALVASTTSRAGAPSLDLALGYAGIVTLGHAAFYGLGAYAAGILAVRVTGDPLAGLVFATVLAALPHVILAGFVLGLSTRKVGESLLAILGRPVSASTVIGAATQPALPDSACAL